jgi:hypothetical protein
MARDSVYTLLADIHILSAFCIARKHVKSGCLNNFWSHVFTGKKKDIQKSKQKEVCAFIPKTKINGISKPDPQVVKCFCIFDDPNISNYYTNCRVKLSTKGVGRVGL